MGVERDHAGPAVRRAAAVRAGGQDHYPLPTSTYALSKVATETNAGHFAGWSGIPFVALRSSNIWRAEDYREFPPFWAEARDRKRNLRGYIDERDVALSCRLALEAPHEAVAGSPAFIIAAADTVMNRPSADQGCCLRRPTG